MNQIDVISHGRTPKAQGWKLGFWVALFSATCLLNPMFTQAGGSAMTQLEFIQWVASVTGESGQFGPGSTAGDFIQWARDKGMNPEGGWQADAVMTTDALAQVMVQLFGLNPKKFGGDLKKNLLREGIVLPETTTVTRTDLMSFVDQLGFQSRAVSLASADSSPSSASNPPSGWLNPKNPNFGETFPGGPPGGVPPGHVKNGKYP